MRREAERLTATCMREQGFEYTPQDVDNGSFFGGIGDDLPYFSDEWVEKYGFGITTQSFPQSQVGDLVGYNDERGILNGSEIPQDPNQEYLETLSEGEREAYEAALWGLPPDFGEGEPTEEDFANFEPSGCQFEAFDEAFNQSKRRLMALSISIAAEQPDFFGPKSNDTNSALWPQTIFYQDLRRPRNNTNSRTIINSARALVPAIKMRAH